jgi:hypothetical protein
LPACAGGALQFDTTQVLRSTGAIMTLRDPLMVCLQPWDQFFQIFCRDSGLGDNQDGTAYQHRDRFEVLHHIVLERVDSSIDDELICRAYGDRVTVRRCARDTSNGDAAARTAHVFNHHRLRECPPHGFGQNARERIK